MGGNLKPGGALSLLDLALDSTWSLRMSLSHKIPLHADKNISPAIYMLAGEIHCSGLVNLGTSVPYG